MIEFRYTGRTDRAQEILRVAGMTAFDVGCLLGVSESYVKKMLAGKNGIVAADLFRLATELQIRGMSVTFEDLRSIWPGVVRDEPWDPRSKR